MSTECTLPVEAMPNLIHLMNAFKKALQAQILDYKQTGDARELRRVVINLRRDLEGFKENFDSWYQNAETTEEYLQLEELAKNLGEAQELVRKAANLI